jgi:hypothetical protein
MPPKRGDRFEFGPDDARIKATVVRVSSTGKWADLACRAPGGWSWSKRYHLPFADSTFVAVP